MCCSFAAAPTDIGIAAYSNAESVQLQEGFVYYELEASIISVPTYVDDIVNLYAKEIETADAFVFVFDHSSKASATFIERALQQVCKAVIAPPVLS